MRKFEQKWTKVSEASWHSLKYLRVKFITVELIMRKLLDFPAVRAKKTLYELPTCRRSIVASGKARAIFAKIGQPT